MELTADFRISIIRALIHDYQFAQKFIDHLKVEYFETFPEKMIFSKFKEFFTKYNKRPIREDMVQMTADHKEDDFLTGVIRIAYKPGHLNIGYLSDELQNFCVQQELKNAIEKSYNELLPENKFDEILTMVKKSISFKGEFEALGTDYAADAENRKIRRDTPDLYYNYIPTGIVGLDDVIRGLRAPQVGVLIGPPKMGKSMFLVNVARGALMFRKNILYYTFELSESDICDRIDACLTGCPMSNLRDNISELDKRLRTIKMLKSQMIVKFFPTRRATVNTLASHMNELENTTGFKPDLIIVDYPARMKPMIDRKDKRIEVEDIFLDLIGWAGEINIPMWAVHQATRQGINNEDMGMEHISESMEPARGCDVILGMSATNAQRSAGVANIHVLGSRNGPDSIKLYAKREAAAMRIQTIQKDVFKKIMADYKVNEDGEPTQASPLDRATVIGQASAKYSKFNKKFK